MKKVNFGTFLEMAVFRKPQFLNLSPSHAFLLTLKSSFGLPYTAKTGKLASIYMWLCSPRAEKGNDNIQEI